MIFTESLSADAAVILVVVTKQQSQYYLQLAAFFSPVAVFLSIYQRY